MQKRILTVAILGVGARGGDAYGMLINQAKEKFDIVALCDLRQERLDVFGEKFGVKEENRFLSEDDFFAEKRADVLVIATPDPEHVRHAVRAFETGYDIMVEKPISDKREEIEQLLATQKKYGKKALVCHVLRYAPAFLKTAEMIDSGIIGRLVAINALERVGYWHQAHSYVRGNWRNDACATPMILAKCCHDLDLIQYYAKSSCVSVSSVGDLTFFKAENAPEGAAMRCTECKHIDTCPYSAKTIYPQMWKARNCPEDSWPFNVVAAAPVTEEKLQAAIENGPYGRCAFYCDNNVVDHQITQMTFANGVKATLTMTGFTAGGGRRMHFHGTLGELVLDEFRNKIYLHRFGEDEQEICLEDLTENGYGHGGGDFFLVQNLYDMVLGNLPDRTSLTASAESHLIGICAEESRREGGKLINVHND